MQIEEAQYINQRLENIENGGPVANGGGSKIIKEAPNGLACLAW